MSWCYQELEDLEQEFSSHLMMGLTEEEVKKRRLEHGPNQLDEKPPIPLWARFVSQLKDFMIMVLIVASVISFLLGERIDAYIIIAIVIVNALLGVYQEERAERALDALKKLSSPHAKVIRGGKQSVVLVEELVVGDVVVLEAGDFVPADVRLYEVKDLKVEESSLTGESLAVEKHDDAIKDRDVALGDRLNMAFMGTVVTYGRAKGMVVCTGMQTQMGGIAKMIADTEEEKTPLQEKLAHLGKVLAILSLIVSGFIFLVGILRGHAVFEMFMTAISLAVAAIPEGLPSIVTITLALGMQRMVKKKSIVRRLPAVETLGSTTVICSDKTGTLTMNKMSMQKLFVHDELVVVAEDMAINENIRLLILGGVLCNDAHIEFEGKERVTSGDPTEIAYVELAYDQHIDVSEERRISPRVDEYPFDSERKMMSTVHSWQGGLRSYTKGASDEIIARSTHIYQDGVVKPMTEEQKDKLVKVNEELSSQALRVLAVAYKDHAETLSENKDDWEEKLVFLGLTGMMDPPREEAKVAIAQCKKAGIKTVMITGDHGITAMAIAKQLSLVEEGHDAVTGAQLQKMSDTDLEANVDRYRVYARVSPEHKVRIVKAWKKRGDIVAMTGDGVNDAPALKNADIGVAMGITGTEVAKGASDMIINDDNFATIVTAVREGRRIFNNILKAVQFLLGCNIGEIMVIFVAILIGLPSPLKPIHILWVNLVTDSFIALALGFEPEDEDIMSVPPRDPKDSIFAKGLGSRVAYQGMMIGLLTLIAFVWGYNIDVSQGASEPLMGRTMAFMTLALSQLVHSFNIKAPRASLFKTGIGNNKTLLGAFLVSGLLQLAVISTSFTRKIFEIELLDAASFGVVVALVLTPLLIVEIEKAISPIFPWAKKKSANHEQL